MNTSARAPFPNFIVTDHAASWDEFLAWLAKLQGTWCFRGQRDANWLLNTSLDRAVRQDFSSATSSGYYHLDRETESRELLFRFQQRAHRYIPAPPSAKDLSSWFALMQHHGVPTRFLDWTQSAYVGLFFAFEEEPPEDGCAVWAIDLDRLEAKAQELLPEAPLLGSGDYNEWATCVNGLLSQTEKAVILKLIRFALTPAWLHSRAFFCASFFIRRRLASSLGA